MPNPPQLNDVFPALRSQSELEQFKAARIAEAIHAAESGSPGVDLSGLGLVKVPDAILRSSSLKRLNLSHNRLREFSLQDGQLPNVDRVDLRFNALETVSPRQGLLLDWTVYQKNIALIPNAHVRGIRLDVAPSSYPPKLGWLQELEVLDLRRSSSRHNGDVLVRKLDRLLPTVSWVGEIDLTACYVRRLPTVLASLNSLITLRLAGNPLGLALQKFSGLRMLRSLWLDRCGIQALPDWILALESLQRLSVKFNEIRVLPDKMGSMKSLSHLEVDCNYIGELPSTFGMCSKLQALGLSNNPFARIPEPIWELAGLRTLRVDVGHRHRGYIAPSSRNTISEIPSDILRLGALEALEIDVNKIQTPPKEITARGLYAIRDYWRQRVETGVDYLGEAKLLLVGEPGAGKTSLAHKIVDQNYKLHDGEPSTEGIDVTRWGFTTMLRPKDAQEREQMRDFSVSIWDFGGQEIYHATHQFFLTRRSLYVLVSDCRKEDTDFEYWLNVVSLLSDGSPVLIVQNEKQNRQLELDVMTLRARFPNLREVLATNLADGRGLADVVRCIRRHLEGLPHIGDPLPATWQRVRVALEENKQDYVPATTFFAICEEHGFTRHADKLQLSGYLHDLGICLHFQEDQVLKNWVILRPSWGTDAVYRILDDGGVIARKGRFSRADAAAIWSEACYVRMHDELLQLMMRFRLCYQLAGTDTFIAPQLLARTRPEYEWDTRQALTLKYRYEFMPKGIVTRLIVALHHLIERHAVVWRTGAVFSREGMRCQVVEDLPRRQILVQAAGEHSKELLSIVDHELEKIHQSFEGSLQRLSYDKMVPCNCRKCLGSSSPEFYRYETLLQVARDKETIKCLVSYELVDAGQLLRGTLSAQLVDLEEDPVEDKDDEANVPEPEPLGEVYVSYSCAVEEGEGGGDVAALDDALFARNIKLIQDRKALGYKGSIGEFMAEFGSARCILLLLGTKYFESKECMYELLEVFQHPDALDHVFPILLPDLQLRDAKCRLAITQSWERKFKELDDELKKGSLAKKTSVQAELELFDEIRIRIDKIMMQLQDMHCRKLDDLRATGFKDVIDAIEESLGSGDLDGP